MNAPWWGKEVSQQEIKQAMPPGAFASAHPHLVVATRDEVFQELSARIASFTPEWTNRRPGEAGIALAHLFSEEMEPVLQRTNQLPEKSFVEFLRTAGVQPLPATPAEALLQFTVSDSATQSVYVAQGFQVSAPPAGSGDPVIFETNADLYAAPGKIQEMYALEKGFYRAIDPTTDNVPFQPFGRNPRPGAAFFIGISANPGVVLGPQLSLGIQVQGPAGQPPPVSTGGVAPLPLPLAPLLRWDVLDGFAYTQADVLTDETGGLLQSGVVTLVLPDEWNPGIPQGSPDTAPLFWLRLQITYGAYPQAPVLLSVQLNMVRATAVQTFYDEVLTPVANTGGSVMSLTNTPVRPGSLFLSVDDTADISFTPPSTGSPASAGGTPPPAHLWQEVDDLSQFGPEDEVYVLDSATGEVTFGDGVHGKVPPPGFRNIVAISYQVGGGEAGAVDAKKISGPVISLPFITGVTNPQPATGGMDAETQDQAQARGPSEIRARGRAVAAADYEILALRATGAQVARAHAVPGFHPVFPGTPIPGVVCVFVVPVERGIGPPTPDEETLRAVSNYLSSQLAPAGVEVVTAAPLFHRVRVQVSVVIEPGVSRGVAVTNVLTQLNSYLDPVTGGDDGRGWLFGGTLSYASFVRRVLTYVPEITAVPRLNFVVDGMRGAACADFPISPNSLVWPVEHEVIALAPGDQS
jgi:predicted phage baseplate assembly protein